MLVLVELSVDEDALEISVAGTAGVEGVYRPLGELIDTTDTRIDLCQPMLLELSSLISKPYIVFNPSSPDTAEGKRAKSKQASQVKEVASIFVAERIAAVAPSRLCPSDAEIFLDSSSPSRLPLADAAVFFA